jgi:hypothetical protein
MKMKLTINDAAEILFSDENANWSRAGAYALAEYLEEYEDSTGEELDFDKVAIRCDFAEYLNLREWLTEYYGKPFEAAMLAAGIDLEGTEDDDEIDELIASHVRNHGDLIEFGKGVIVSAF